MDRQHPGRYEKSEMTSDMTENRHYWKMMGRMAHKDVEMVSKDEKYSIESDDD